MAEQLELWEIYELWSLDACYVYVGSSWRRPATHRLKMHLSGKGNAPALRDAIVSGIEFNQVVCDSGHGTQQDALDAEQEALNRVLLLDNVKVLNLNLYPATQGYARSPAVREKMKEAAKARWADVDRRQKALEDLERGKETEEAKINRSEGQKRRVRTDAEVERLRTLALGISHSDEARKRHSEATKEVWTRPGERERRGAARKRAWDEWRAQRQMDTNDSTESK